MLHSAGPRRLLAEGAIEEEGEAVVGRLMELVATRWAGRGGLFEAATPPPLVDTPG